MQCRCRHRWCKTRWPCNASATGRADAGRSLSGIQSSQSHPRRLSDCADLAGWWADAEDALQRNHDTPVTSLISSVRLRTRKITECQAAHQFCTCKTYIKRFSMFFYKNKKNMFYVFFNFLKMFLLLCFLLVLKHPHTNMMHFSSANCG